MSEQANYTVLEIVASLLAYDKLPAEMQYSDELPSALELIEQKPELMDFEYAKHVIETVTQHHMLRTLTYGKQTKFAQKSYDILQEPEQKVPDSKIRILLYIVGQYNSVVANNRISEFASGSEYVGEVGSKLNLELEIIRCTLITPGPGSNYNQFYIAIALDKNGNLFSFSPKNPIELTKSCTYKVIARVKKHEVNNYMKQAKVTYLNYVKEQHNGIIKTHPK